jgi:hypothetical protein
LDLLNPFLRLIELKYNLSKLFSYLLAGIAHWVDFNTNAAFIISDELLIPDAGRQTIPSPRAEPLNPPRISWVTSDLETAMSGH